VEPISRTPTEAADYAVLSAVDGTVLAASAGNDMLQAAFSSMCAHATAEQRIAADPAILRALRQSA
jgi:hypothetical protein